MNFFSKKSISLAIKRRKRRYLSEAQLIVSSFLAVLIPASLLLTLPWFTVGKLSFIDALFTATSALSVTGLGVVDAGTHFTLSGKVILMCLMEIGGLGQMTLSTLLVVLMGIKMSLKQKALTQAQLNISHGLNIGTLTRRIVFFALISQCIGFIVLSFQFVPQFGWEQGLLYALFHAISAFNNAGFSLFPNNMIDFAFNPLVVFTLASLIIIGGLGFTVIMDLWRCRCQPSFQHYFLFFKFHKLSLHSKIMVTGTTLLVFGGTIAIYWLEQNNPKTLGSLDIAEGMMTAFFQSVTTRTAGFNTLNIANMIEPTLFIMLLLMLVGAGSTSTGGGLKVTTIAISMRAGMSYLRQQDHVTLFRRTVSWQMVNRTLAVMMISGLVIISSTFFLLISEKTSFEMALFETVSAFSTVGLTIGLTEQLTEIGKLILVTVMVIGRIGPITIFYLLSSPKPTHIKYVEGHVMIG